MIWTAFSSFCAGVGLVCVIVTLTWLLLEALRAAYWAVWCFIPQYKQHRDKATLKLSLETLRRGFKSEFMCCYYRERR